MPSDVLKRPTPVKACRVQPAFAIRRAALQLGSRCAVAAVALVIVPWFSVASADEIVQTDGTVRKGEIKSFAAGTLQFLADPEQEKQDKPEEKPQEQPGENATATPDGKQQQQPDAAGKPDAEQNATEAEAATEGQGPESNDQRQQKTSEGEQPQHNQTDNQDPPKNEVQSIAVASLRSLRLVPPAWPSPQGIVVVDNDRAQGVQEKSGKIKLKAGLHRFTLPYWHGSGAPTLQLQYEAPGVQRTTVPHDLLFSLAETEFHPSPAESLDEDGLRPPEAPANTDHAVAFQVSSWKELSEVRSVYDIRMAPLMSAGRSAIIHAGVGPQDRPFAIVYRGYFKAPSDGEYTFHLKSDGGSQLHIGAEPRWLGPTVAAPRPTDWKVVLNSLGQLRGSLTAWDSDSTTFTLLIGTDSLPVTMPRSAIRELWTSPVVNGELKVDRDGETTDADSVYAKNASGQVARVAGTVLGINKDALQFLYQDKERVIKLERIVGIVLRRETADSPPGAYFQMDLPGGHSIPVRWQALTDEQATFETIWGNAIALPRLWVGQLAVKNGNVHWLSDITPADVEQTPWFGREIPYRKDISITGNPLQIDKQVYDRGVCVHSRTVLEYDLGGDYQRFRCVIGLQRPEGELGNAAVRVLADDNVLWETPSLTSDSEPQTVDVDVAEKARLKLEVDFGERYDVGDHVVFADAYLLKSGTTP